MIVCVRVCERVHVHVLLRQVGVGGLHAASSLGHWGLVALMKLLQSVVPGRSGALLSTI